MGCFWCAEAIFRTVPGLQAFQVGYMGGSSPNPDYRSVCTGTTGHAEVLHFEYSGGAARYAQLVQLFLQGHDPTSSTDKVPTVVPNIGDFTTLQKKQTALATRRLPKKNTLKKLLRRSALPANSIPLSSCIKITLSTTDLRPTARVSSNPSWISYRSRLLTNCNL